MQSGHMDSHSCVTRRKKWPEAMARVARPRFSSIDREHRLIYHGAPDSNYQDPGGAVPHLRHALDAALEARTPPVAETPPVGCTIKWRPK